MATAKKARPRRIVARAPKNTYTVSNRGIVFSRDGRKIAKFSLRQQRLLSCSCGVMEANGMSGLARLIAQDNIPVDVVKKAFKAYVAIIKRMKNAAFLVLSNNSYTPKANAIVDSLANGRSVKKRSPGTGNQIRIWTL